MVYCSSRFGTCGVQPLSSQYGRRLGERWLWCEAFTLTSSVAMDGKGLRRSNDDGGSPAPVYDAWIVFV